MAHNKKVVGNNIDGRSSDEEAVKADKSDGPGASEFQHSSGMSV